MSKQHLAFIAFIVLVVLAVSVLASRQPIKPQYAESPLILARTQTPAPTSDVPGNLLVNPGFEGAFGSCGQSCNVAPGWNAWTSETLDPPCVAGEPGCSIPCPSNCDNCRSDYGCWWTKAEHKAATLQFPERVRTGASAQQYFFYGRMGDAGVYQVVGGLEPGALYEFSAWVQGWQCYERYNCQPEAMRLAIGVDATGGTDPYAAQWTYPIESWEVYTRLALEFVAEADTVTLFTYAGPRWQWARVNNDAYVDDAALVLLQPAPTPTPSPTPTNTPGPMTERGYVPVALNRWQPATSTPTPAPTDIYTDTALVVLPAQNEISISETLTLTLYAANFDAVQAVELTLFWQPVVLGYSRILTGGPMLCDVAYRARWQPGSVRIECEDSEPVTFSWVRLFDVVLTGAVPGSAVIFPYGQFVGEASGWGYVPRAAGAVVEVH